MYHMFKKTRLHIAVVMVGISIGFVFLVIFLLPDRSVVARDFPRRANYFLNWQIREYDVPLLARYDLLILDMEAQVSSRSALTDIRLRNPDIQIFVYITPQEILNEAGTGTSVLRDKLKSMIHLDWYLRNSKGQTLSWWPGSTLLNVTTRAPKSSGIMWNDTLVRFVVDDLLSTGVWDGVFYDNAWDNISWFVGGDVDVDLDGQADADADRVWRDGMRRIYLRTRELTGGRYPVVVNGLTREYQDVTNGQMLENFGQHDWQELMTTYRTGMADNIVPAISIINANTANRGNSSDFRNMRFGLTSALMEDGFFSFDFGDTRHGDSWWYDEYDVDLGADLGESRNQGSKINYSTGVYTRQFEHGVAIVNSGSSTETIVLPGEFEKIHGAQDVKTNDGRIVSSVRVGSRDGIVLLKNFSVLDDVVFTNGNFVRFLGVDGIRVRNGKFIFDDGQRGGDIIIRTDLDGNGKRDFLRVRGAQVEAWRDDGQILFQKFPYTANFKGKISIAVGDIDGDGTKEVVVAPENSVGGVFVYGAYGEVLTDSLYPFGVGYKNGISVAIGNVDGGTRSELIFGAGVGSEPRVNVYTMDTNFKFRLLYSWLAFGGRSRAGVEVVSGNILGDHLHEIIVGEAIEKRPRVQIYDRRGTALGDTFQVFSSFDLTRIHLRTLDVNFDGLGEIIVESSGI
jgi:hypothetical protein